MHAFHVFQVEMRALNAFQPKSIFRLQPYHHVRYFHTKDQYLN